MVSAISERLSRLKPTVYMMAKVPSSEIGTTALGMSVARKLRRNIKMTSTTRQMVRSSVNSTSNTDARIVTVRSLTTSTFTPAGITLLSFGKAA